MDSSDGKAPVKLGAFDIACLVVGGIIGIGIFLTPAKVAAGVGGAGHVMIAWAIGGLLAILGALTYAGLGRLVPGPGGVYAYLREAFGALPAFLYGWCNLWVIQSGAVAIVALFMVDHLGELLGWAEFEPTAPLRAGIAAATILLLTGVNIAGVRMGRGVQVFLTVLKTCAVFAVVVVAMLVDGPARPAEAPREVGFWTAMGAAILPVLFAFGGWQQGSFVAGIARNPRRDVPLGIIAGVLVVVVAYLSINLAFLDLLGFEAAGKSERIAVDALRVALGSDAGAQQASRIFAGIIVISALGIINTICMAPPYVLHAMSREGLFFVAVGRLHGSLGTPVVAMLLQGCWAVVLIVASNLLARQGWFESDPLFLLLDGVVFVDWLGYGACGLGLFLMLRPGMRTQDGPGALSRWIGLAFASGALMVTGAALWVHRGPALAGLAVLVLGVPAYLRFRRT